MHIAQSNSGHRWPIIILTLALMTGCASVTTQVTTFHEIPAGTQPLAGQTFIVTTAPAQQQSIEFKAYAREVETALVSKGLVAAKGNTSDLVVNVDYGAGPAPILSSPSSGVSLGGFGFGGGGGGGIGLGIGVPLGGASSQANYRKDLRVQIDRSKPVAGAASTRLYEATATSEGSDPSLSKVMPVMVKAVFEDFPGKSGQTRVVRDSQ